MIRNLYLDSDGVLADFDSFILDRFGKTGPEIKEEVGEHKLWEMIHSIPNFFQQLPKMPGADRLVSGLRHLHPTILTGVHEGDLYSRDAADKTI